MYTFCMIIVKVQGGLGNQLFQYSFGQLIAETYKKEVAYDLSFFEGNHSYTKRPYLLDMLGFTAREATVEEINKVKYPYGITSRGVWIWKKILNKFFFKKYHIGYEEGFLEKIKECDSLYVEGYFQSYRYVSPILENLKKEIFLRGVSESYMSYLQKITLSKAVFVHIRRGDYANNTKEVETLSIAYYQEAVRYVDVQVVTPQYYIFSDDISWVKKEMGHIFNGAVYVSGQGVSVVEELMLMSACQHGIIANSTFSWWGGMLMKIGGDAKHTIICPKDWKNIYIQSKEVCPPEWVRV